MKLTVNVVHKQYDILIERGIINKLNEYLDVDKKYFILTDTNIPDALVDQVRKQCPNSHVYRVAAGEGSKSIETYKMVLEAMLDYHMTRKDVLIALGGGVIGDLGGFVAASYMRGISFMSIPTTTLSQIDSSIGGKVAVNLGKVKNIVGAFYHPDLVLIDIDTLSTLPKRHVMSGLVEALKAGLIHDASLYVDFKKGLYKDHLEEVIYRSLLVKRMVVEQDEKENGLRKTLNFGHTIGHGIETYYNLETYYHGECVAMGMLYFIENEQLKEEVRDILKAMEIPLTNTFDKQQVYDIITMDKKAFKEMISVVVVKEAGKAYLQDIPMLEMKQMLERNTL